MTRIRWFSDRDDLVSAASDLQAVIQRVDRPLAASATACGHCTACGRPTVFDIGNGSLTGGSPNLREGVCCAHCKLTQRQRLIHLALREEVDARGGALRGALLERSTLLYRRAHVSWPWLIGSEFLGPDRVSGRRYWWSTHWWRWRRTRHESITSFSHASQSLDLLAHSDVLEHVHDTGAALRECARVLRKGGAMLFTVPFHVDRPCSVLRGRPLSGGGIEHIEPPEYHGDGVRHGGIYTFHNFGWDLLDRMKDAGFDRAEIGMHHAPDEGFTASNPEGDHAWMGLPFVFRATK